MDKLRAALKRLERIVFLPPNRRPELHLVQCRNVQCRSEIRVHGSREAKRGHLALVRTRRDIIPASSKREEDRRPK